MILKKRASTRASPRSEVVRGAEVPFGQTTMQVLLNTFIGLTLFVSKVRQNKVTRPITPVLKWRQHAFIDDNWILFTFNYHCSHQ